MFKKWLTLVLVACLCVSLLPMSALAAQPFVLFTPWSNTSTAEDLKEVRQAIEQEIADSIGLSLDWIVVPTDGSLEKLNVLLASGDQLDAATMNIGDAMKYATGSDLVMPLNDLLNEYGKDLLANIPAEAWVPCTNTKGEILFIPDYYQWRWQGCVIRTDLLKEQGLSMPTTIAELENVMEVFKNAYPDMIPATGLPWFSDPFLQGAVSGKASQMTEWVLSPEGKVVPSMTLPEYKNMVTLYKKWVDSGWFDPEFLSGNDDSQTLLWTSGRVGIWFCDPHRPLIWARDALLANFPNAEATFMPVPMNDQGVKSFPVSYGVGRVLWIRQDTKVAKEIVQFFNKMIAEPDFYRLCDMGIEGKHWIDKGANWGYPENITSENAPYNDIYRPLSWEFLDILKPMENTDPATENIHNALNEEYATAELIKTGLEGFTVDSSNTGMYTPIDLFENMFNIVVGVSSLDDFDSIVENWYATGGTQLVEEYTRQYNEWLASQK